MTSIIEKFKAVAVEKEINHKDEDFGLFEGVNEDGKGVIIKMGDNSLFKEFLVYRILDSKNFARLLGVFLEEGRYYFVMEKLPGEPMSKIVKLKRIDTANWKIEKQVTELCLKIVIGLAKRIQELHERNLLHRDLPFDHAIFDSNKNKVSLIDLEAVIFPSVDGKFYNFERIGTWETMAPEEFEIGAQLSFAANVYSIGVVLYSLVFGSLPVKVSGSLKTKEDYHRAHREQAINFPGEVEEGVARIIQRCLAKEPKERYQKVSDLIADLEDIQKNYESKK